MDERFDVVIAGAGPAGAQCARDLATRNYDVLVLETEAEDGFPKQSNKSTGGTFPSMLTSFNVPDDVVMEFTDKIVLESPNHSYVRPQTGAVLEFADFKRFLVEDGQNEGAEYWFDARVSGPVMEDGDAVGVRYNGSEEVYADVIVDATGPSAPLARELDVVDLRREKQAIGIEYELDGVDLDHPDFADLRESMMLRLDHNIAPGGYSWIFHTGDDTAKVGVCYIQNESHRDYADDGLTIDGYLTRWLDEDPRFADASILEGKQHRGSAHIQMPTGLSTDNFMAIGDTVPTIDPLWGEGIHKGMKSARAAAVTVDSCLTPSSRDTSAEALELYDQLWHSRVAPNMRTRLLMTELLYLATNERYDTLMQDLNRMNEDTLAAVNHGSLTDALKLFRLNDLSLLKRFARERYAN